MTEKELEKIDNELQEAHKVSDKIKFVEKFLQNLSILHIEVRVSVPYFDEAFPSGTAQTIQAVEEAYGLDVETALKEKCFLTLTDISRNKLAKLKEEFEKMEVKLETNF